jgi:hypothetical protein
VSQPRKGVPVIQLCLLEPAPEWIEALLQADQAKAQDKENDMRNGTPVNILIPNRFRTRKNDPEFVKVPGVVVSDPIGSSYVNRNTGATVQTANVEVISYRDTRASNPQGGRCWYQLSTEPMNLLLRRFGDAVVGLDVDEAGQRMLAPALYSKVEASIIEFRLRQSAARHRAAEPRAELLQAE